MNVILELFRNYTEMVLLVSVILIVLLTFITLFNIFRTSSIIKRYKRLMRGGKGRDLEKLMLSHLELLESIQTKLNNSEITIAGIKEQMKTCLQKVGVCRYNAFQNMGSDLSFSVCLLDENHNGFIITGLYGREYSTTYSKPIENGKSKYSLSDEEKESLNIALKK